MNGSLLSVCNRRLLLHFKRMIVWLFLVLPLIPSACSGERGNRSLIYSAPLKPGLEDPLRPQFHYTADSNFISDPNGLVFYQGVYHLFHQYNPYDIRSGVPQHWAHAVSKDLVHWERMPIAIYPHEGGNIWSGSAVVDRNNTSGLQAGVDPPIVAFYTWQKDFTQRMTYSSDGGMNWTEFSENPVVPHLYDHNRDPKVFWHGPSGQWVMILYTKGFEVFVSDNLKDWTHSAYLDLEGFHECPDFFELPVDSRSEDKRWVVMDGAGRYYIGEFDGAKFTAESGRHYSDWNGALKEFYATQTWSNIPPEDGRRIQIACMRDRKYKIPEEKFHNQLTFPCELTLRSTEEGLRLFRWPVREIEGLYREEQQWADVMIYPGKPFPVAEEDLLDIRIQLEFPPSEHETTRSVRPFDALSFSFNIRGTDVLYDVGRQEINCGAVTAPLKISEEGRIDIRILVDKISLEVFGNEGRVSISAYINPSVDNHATFLTSTGGKTRILKLAVNELKSIW